MNYINHIAFSRHILKHCGLEERVACFAILPVFINKGPSHHSIFSHALVNLPDLMEVWVEVLDFIETKNQDTKIIQKSFNETLQSLKQDIQNATNYEERSYFKKRSYFYEQLSKELSNVCDHYIRVANESSLPSVQFFRENQLALFLSISSYIYFDLWITPRQIFSPMTYGCSGTWDLWKDIDYSGLVQSFRDQEESEDFSSRWFEQYQCTAKFDGFAMLKALIVRMGELGSSSISYSVVDWHIRILLRYVGANVYKRIDTELEFLESHAGHLESCFRKVFKKQ